MPIDEITHAELVKMVLELSASNALLRQEVGIIRIENAALKAENAALKEEIARLKEELAYALPAIERALTRTARPGIHPARDREILQRVANTC